MSSNRETSWTKKSMPIATTSSNTRMANSVKIEFLEQIQEIFFKFTKERIGKKNKN